ncbi:hypothetical protein EZ456_02185 [Pedobacter psychrodurus]|uniref:Lipoprotein n=1 Tax=Pedobacter psychrodurus TaxID=2530456 RepID=A0A4R0Q6S0_9SPHI|nr:hypothetical protein [Pedobacter psychrodurus]TCD28990.1 hypothetical protein EZ456_02185 [Pedobacter psychrodurus]
MKIKNMFKYSLFFGLVIIGNLFSSCTEKNNTRYQTSFKKFSKDDFKKSVRICFKKEEFRNILNSENAKMNFSLSTNYPVYDDTMHINNKIVGINPSHAKQNIDFKIVFQQPINELVLLSISNIVRGNSINTKFESKLRIVYKNKKWLIVNNNDKAIIID